MQIQSTYKDILNIALPVMVGSIAMTVLNITDTIFLGRVGEVELGASAIGGVLFFVFAMIGISIGTGAQILIARRSGEKEDKKIGEIFDNSLIILFFISLLLFTVLKWMTPFILHYLLDSEDLTLKTIAFLKYRSYGIIFLMVAIAFRSFYVGIAKTFVIGMYSFLMAVINFLLWYVFIFGNNWFQPMGIAGAGLASTLAELIALIYIIVYTLIRCPVNFYNLFRFSSISTGILKKIMNLSLPLVVQNILSMGSWFIFFIFIEKVGQHALATSNIVRGAYMINMTPIWGFSVAANSMVSNIIGQGKKDEVLTLLIKIIKVTMVIALLMALLDFIIPSYLLQIFSDDSVLIDDSIASLKIVGWSMLAFSFAIVAISGLSGTGATKTALLIEFGAISIYLIYNYTATFIFHWKVEMIWMSELIYWIFTGIASYVYIKSNRWQKINI